MRPWRYDPMDDLVLKLYAALCVAALLALLLSLVSP